MEIKKIKFTKYFISKLKTYKKLFLLVDLVSKTDTLFGINYGDDVTIDRDITNLGEPDKKDIDRVTRVKNDFKIWHIVCQHKVDDMLEVINNTLDMFI